jgi:hypothetical protein
MVVAVAIHGSTQTFTLGGMAVVVCGRLRSRLLHAVIVNEITRGVSSIEIRPAQCFVTHIDCALDWTLSLFRFVPRASVGAWLGREIATVLVSSLAQRLLQLNANSVGIVNVGRKKVTKAASH